MTPPPVRIALVGLGGHGKTIQSACEQAPNLEIVAVHDINADETAAAAERFDCRIASSFEVMIRENDIDAVSFVTPNHLHRAQVEAALNAGKHVFVEKPIANTIADGLSMIQKAETSGLILMVGHNMRFSRSARKAREFLEAGRLGDIVTTEIHFSSDTGMKLSPESWRLKPEQCPLLPVMQLAIHAFDLVHYLVGRIEEVAAHTRALKAGPGVVDSVTASFRVSDGSLGTMVSNYCSPVLFEYRISGTKGMMRCTPDTFWFQSNEPPQDGDRDFEEDDYSGFGFESYTRQMEAFGHAVQQQSLPETDGWVGLQALAVVDAMQRSSIEQSPWSVQQFENSSFPAS